MYPIVCFSCGRPIGHLWHIYYNKLQEYDEGDRIDKDYQSNAKFRALNDIGIGDECCRRMFISQIKYEDLPIIK